MWEKFKDGTIKYEKKVREPPNVTKELSYVMLEPHNVTMKPSKCDKKEKGTTKCDKSIVKCDVRTAPYEDEAIKCEKIK